MIRKPMEDVVVHRGEPKESGLISDTRVNNAKVAKGSTSVEHDRIENNPFFEKVKTAEKRSFESRTPTRIWLWVFVFLALAATAFTIANYFASATIEITPLAYQSHLEHDFVSAKQNGLSSSTTTAPAFNLITLTDEKSVEVSATLEQKIDKKAFGKVLIYNFYSKDAQRLIKNTRLESVEHKIFRIDQSVVVPGSKIIAGKIQPGSVEALVYADAPGVDYNIGVSNFTIPGFKGDPRYSKFSASSKPDSLIAGGFSGTVKAPEASVVLKAQDDLKEALKVSAVEKARALIPPGMTFFPGSTVLKFEEVPQDFAAADLTKVTVKATVTVFFFDTALITQKFAKASLANYQENPVTLSNISAIAFTFTNPIDSTAFQDLTELRFHVVGDLTFIGKIDSEKIRADLVGKEKQNFGKIIVSEQNIGKAEATVRPIWKTTFPIDPKKITINVSQPDKL